MTLPKAVVENRQDQKHREKERMKNGRSELWREGLREVYDIFYLPDGSLRHTLDLIRPEGQEKLPVIIEIHGGGYIACEKNINRLHARAFAQQGFAVVNGDYTLHPEADFVAELRELAAIVDWVGENAERYGLDAERVYMSGDSAGGHLVLLYAMLQGNRSFQEKICVMPGRCAIRAAAPTCPAFSLSGGGVAGAALAMLLPLMYPEGVEPDYLETFDVLRLIPESEYPPLIITTTPEDELLYEEDLILEKALAESGRPYRFCSWPEKANKLGHVFNVLFPELEESREANRAIADYFRAQG